MSDIILPDNTEPSLPTLPNLVSTPRSTKIDMERDPKEELRRDSSSSNDSCKKLPSLNEIEELYSALTDLVKTNVSTAPLSVPIKENEIKPGERSRANTQSIPITTSQKNEIDKKKAVFRRAASTSNGFGNFVTQQANSRRTSAQPFKSDTTQIDEGGACNGTRKNARSISLGGANAHTRTGGTLGDLDSRDNKKWKHKLLSRIRSKTSVTKQNSNEGNDNKNPFDLTDVRRHSDNDYTNHRHTFPNKDSTTSRTYNTLPKMSNKLTEIGEDDDIEGAENIDQLVEALNLEESTASLPDKSKSAESELSKLESWFEKAAAQAVMHHSRTSSDYDNDSDGSRTPSGGRETRRRTINRNKKASLKRNKSINDPVKRERRMRQVLPNEDYVSNNINSFVRLQAKSTPNLCDPDIFCDSDDNRDSHDYCRDSGNSDASCDYDTTNNGQDFILENENTEEKGLISSKTNTDETNIKTEPQKRRISLEDNVRLPKSPVFYRPGNDNLEPVTETCTGEVHEIDNKKILDRPMSMPVGIELETQINNSRDANDLITRKINNTELNTDSKTRPKSECSSSVPDELIYNSSNNLWGSISADSGSILNSFLFETNDNHSGYCEGTMLWGNYLNENDTNTANRSSLLLLPHLLGGLMASPAKVIDE